MSRACVPVKGEITKSNIKLRVRLMCMMQGDLRQAYFSTLQLCAMARRRNIASCLLPLAKMKLHFNHLIKIIVLIGSDFLFIRLLLPICIFQENDELLELYDNLKSDGDSGTAAAVLIIILIVNNKTYLTHASHTGAELGGGGSGLLPLPSKQSYSLFVPNIPNISFIVPHV